MNAYTFWFVWNQGGNAQTFQHTTYESAVLEAERLARTHSGQTFVVLESVCARVVDAMKQIDLRSNRNDDGIPF